MFDEKGTIIKMRYVCPVCGTPFDQIMPQPTEECKTCGWLFDSYQYDNHNAKGCINIMSVIECQDAWKHGKPFY